MGRNITCAVTCPRHGVQGADHRCARMWAVKKGQCTFRGGMEGGAIGLAGQCPARLECQAGSGKGEVGERGGEG